MSEMQRRGVTTIIWPIGSNSSGDDGCGHYFQSAGVSLRYLLVRPDNPCNRQGYSAS